MTLTLTTAELYGTYYASVADVVGDSDNDPQLAPLTADVVFTPAIDRGLVEAAVSSNVAIGLVAAPIPARIVNGVLVDNLGSTDVTLHTFIERPLRYVAEFSNVTYSSIPLPGGIKTFKFGLPADPARTNLVDVHPTTKASDESSPSLALWYTRRAEQAAENADVSASAAEEARTGAEDARTGAETAKGLSEAAETRIDIEHEHVHQDVQHVDAIVPQVQALLGQANVFSQDQVPPYLQRASLDASYARATWADVRTYGAKGDGVTDDTEAIQSAMDSMAPSGGCVYFPAGVYVVSANGLRHGSTDTYGALYPQANTTIRGDGPSATIIRLEDGTDKVDVIYAHEKQGLTFEDICVDAGPRQIPYWTTCIQLNTCNDLAVNNVRVTRGNIEGLYLYNSTRFKIANLHAHDNGAWREDASGLHFDSCYNGVADNLVLNNNGFHGLILSSSWELVINNVMSYENGWQGLHLQTGSNKNILNNLMLRGNSRGVYIQNWGTDDNHLSNVVAAHNTFAGVLNNVAYRNVINGYKAISNGEFGIELIEADDELQVFAATFKDNGWGKYKAAPNSFLNINGTQVTGTG